MHYLRLRLTRTEKDRSLPFGDYTKANEIIWSKLKHLPLINHSLLRRHLLHEANYDKPRPVNTNQLLERWQAQ